MKHLPTLWNLRNEMDRMFNESWIPAMDLDLIRPFSINTAFAPKCDVNETEGHYLMSFDLPGVKKEDIKIDLKDGRLTIYGERRDEGEAKEKNYSHQERSFGAFRRVFEMPSGIKPEMIEARYTDGVLRLTVPKTEASKPHQIKIGEGKPSLWDKLVGPRSEDKSFGSAPGGQRPTGRVA